jgi:hypothetical protein
MASRAGCWRIFAASPPVVVLPEKERATIPMMATTLTIETMAVLVFWVIVSPPQVFVMIKKNRFFSFFCFFCCYKFFVFFLLFNLLVGQPCLSLSKKEKETFKYTFIFS